MRSAIAASYTASGSRASRRLSQRVNLPLKRLVNLETNIAVLLFPFEYLLKPAADAALIVLVGDPEGALQGLLFFGNDYSIDNEEKYNRRQYHHRRPEEYGAAEQYRRGSEIHGIAGERKGRNLHEFGWLPMRIERGVAAREKPRRVGREPRPG